MTSSLSNSAPKTRLGAISFVNTVPVYSDYQPDDTVQLVYEVPARLNELVLAGFLDVSPVSSACYLRNHDKLALLDDLSVSSPGAVESVLFLTRTPLGPEMLDISHISVPNDSETSVMLLAYLLKETTGQDFRPWFNVYEAAHYRETLKETGNALIIGDNALMMKASLEESDESYYCYDLSSLWKEKTGQPFVFAVWVANRRWADENPQALRRINRDLREARQRFFADAAVFQKGLQLAQSRSHLPAATLERYYRHCLTYHLDAEHRDSLQRFDAVIQSAANWEPHTFERQPAP